MNKEDFFTNGFSKEFKVELGENLTFLQDKIYNITKNLLVSHDADLSLAEKLNLPFKEIPEDEFWSEIMREINNSNELLNLINCQGVVNIFKKIFIEPERFTISTFRARIPNQRRVIYNWHQDEGTWYLSNNSEVTNKYSATMWLSINGSNLTNSIQLIKGSHISKLFNHSFVKGQGYFKAENLNIFENAKIYTVETKISEAVLFHPLTLHRSVENLSDKVDMYPRYSIDIRYYDKSQKLSYKTDTKFKLKKILNIK